MIFSPQINYRLVLIALNIRICMMQNKIRHYVRRPCIILAIYRYRPKIKNRSARINRTWIIRFSF